MIILILRPKTDERHNPSKDIDFETKFEVMYRRIYEDLVIDEDECRGLSEFLSSMSLSSNQYVRIRGLAIRIGSEYLTSNRKSNTSLLKSINVVVHHLELAYLKPKPYNLKMERLPSFGEISISEIGLKSSLEKAVQHLWNLDLNRLVPNEDYEINVQKGKKPYIKDDVADEPLFASVDEKQFRRATYKAFIALFDNYEADTSKHDRLTSYQERETSHFLDCILQTGPMQFCHKYLCANCADIPKDVKKFKSLLHDIWFTNYSRTRGGKRSSSGFEHVFVGEIDNDEVTGFHNWIRFYLEERKGRVDYKGYIKPRNQSDITNDDDHILTLQFTWNGNEKFVTTLFIGTSPEFEMALYTLCFLLGNDKENVIKLDTGYDIFLINVICHKMYRDKIGSCYIKALEHED